MNIGNKLPFVKGYLSFFDNNRKLLILQALGQLQLGLPGYRQLCFKSLPLPVPLRSLQLRRSGTTAPRPFALETPYSQETPTLTVIVTHSNLVEESESIDEVSTQTRDQ